MSATHPLRPRHVHAPTAAAHLRLLAWSGIVTVLLTRAYLALAGYPKVGGGGSGGLHIAHMLWGGLLMAAGLLVMCALLGSRARRAGALTGGVGFGLFIDEIGKLVTDEPGYFYRPAAALIYACFAALLALAWWVGRRTPPGRLPAADRTAQVTDAALDGLARGGLTSAERHRALARLSHPRTELDAALARLLAALPTLPELPKTPAKPTPEHMLKPTSTPTLSSKLRHRLSPLTARIRGALARVAAHRWTVTLALVYAVLQGYLLLAGITADVVTGTVEPPLARAEMIPVFASTVCAAVTLGLAVRGAVLLRRRERPAGLRLIRASVLTDLFLGQIFNFALNQFAAVTDWLVGLFLLWVLTPEANSAAAARAVRAAAGSGPVSPQPVP
ncbi:hypothetical protein [Streptomyces sp. NPDC048172]|uniref:hypothetical protein n=1 Tax=Streptomyces sp. NPDC048172 TaxID=3365505 RepID=UPI0037182FD0